MLSDAVKTLLIGAIGALIVLALFHFGVLRVSTPWEGIDDPGDLTQQDDVIRPPAPATITAIEPVALDCRARISSEVSVVGTREHRLAGMVFRTDEVSAHVAGDVDTCVDASKVDITTAPDGAVTVSVPGDAIEFVRPRVDLTSPATLVTWDKGFIGEVTDLLPGVADGDDMTVQALAFAQTAIGSSECMSSALAVTQQLLADAYAEQMLEQGADPALLDVQVGTPDLEALDAFEDIPGTTFSVSGGIECVLADDATGGVTPAPARIG